MLSKEESLDLNHKIMMKKLSIRIILNTDKRNTKLLMLPEPTILLILSTLLINLIKDPNHEAITDHRTLSITLRTLIAHSTPLLANLKTTLIITITIIIIKVLIITSIHRITVTTSIISIEQDRIMALQIPKELT